MFLPSVEFLRNWPRLRLRRFVFLQGLAGASSLVREPLRNPSAVCEVLWSWSLNYRFKEGGVQWESEGNCVRGAYPDLGRDLEGAGQVGGYGSDDGLLPEHLMVREGQIDCGEFSGAVSGDQNIGDLIEIQIRSQ